MANEVEIHVKWENRDGDRFAATTKAKAKSVGEKAGDEFSGTFSGKLKAGGEQAGKAAGDAVEVGLRDGSRKGGKAVDGELSRVAARANTAFDGKKFAGLSLGLPAAAAVGAVGVASSLSLAGAAFAGLGVAGVAHTDKVRDSFSSLKSSVVNDVRGMSAPLQGEVVGAIDDVNAAWHRMGPALATGVQASGPALKELTGAATDLAEGALPGMVSGLKASGQAFVGFRTFAREAGLGAGEFFANASKGSAGAGQGMTIFGGTVRTVESRLGTMFANLASGSSGPLRSFDVIVDKVTDGLVDMTSQGSGVVGVLQGASSAGAGAATILGGVLSVASALPAPVTQFAGALGFANLAMSRLSNGNATLGTGFQGLGDKVRSAEGAGAKLKTTMGGLVAGALNPATAATAGLGVAMLLMGQQQERAAAAAAHAAESQRNYTSALRESSGAINDSVRASVAQDLAQKNVGDTGKSLLDFSKQFGLALPEVTSAVTGQAGALDSVKRQLDAYGKAHPEAVGTVNALKAAIMSKGIAFKTSENAIVAEAAATDGSIAAQNAHRDAVSAATQAIYQQQNAQLGLRGAQLNTKQATEEYNKVTKDGKSSQDEVARSMLQLEQAYAAQEQAAYQAAFANSTSKDESVKTAEAFAAQNAETVRLAGALAGPLPISMEQTIGKFTVAQAKAAGLTVDIDRTGQAVYRLPNGKDIKIAADTGQAKAALAEIKRMEDALYNKTVTHTIVNRVVNLQTSGGAYQPSLTGRRAFGASGGLIKDLPTKAFALGGITGLASGGSTMVDITGGGFLRGPGTGTSDSIRALSSAGRVDVADGEFVIRASQTRKHRALLEDINAGVNGFASGGMVKHGTVSESEWDGLYASGWRGDPTDGMEALYEPPGGRSMFSQPSSSAPRRAVQPAAAQQQTIRLEFAGGSGGTLEALLMEVIRKHVRVTGGNVQQTFGAY